MNFIIYKELLKTIKRDTFQVPDELNDKNLIQDEFI
jgi:hypothetical protein